MHDTFPEIRDRLKTPRAAAVAGIAFSILLTATLVILHISVPPASEATEAALPKVARTAVVLALGLVPFTGVAFLWFIGVIRDRLGAYEDRFFATIFLGSGLLFLAMFFASAAVGGAVLVAWERTPGPLIESGAYTLGRALAAQLLNVYAHKMAGMFMFSTATLIARTRVLPLWTAIMGFVLGVLLMLTSHFVDWLGLAFPLWVFILSVYIFVENLRVPGMAPPGGAGAGTPGGEGSETGADGPFNPR